MAEIKTESGFVCTVRDDIGNDWRLVDAVTDAQSDSTMRRLQGLRSLCTLLLGEDGYKALQRHLAAPDGSVDMQAMEKEIIEIFGQVGGSKN